MYVPQPPSDEFRDLAAAMQSLPLEAPSTSVWPTLEGAARATAPRPSARRIRPIWAAAAGTAAIAIAVGWLLPRHTTAPPGVALEVAAPAVDQASDPDARIVADLVARNQALEQALHDSGDAMAIDADYAMAGGQVEELIAAIDGQLAADPDPRNAEVLWRVRLGLLQELSSLRSGGTETLMAGQSGVIAVPADYVIN